MIPLVIYQRADKITIVFDKRVLGKIKQERKMTMKLSKTSILSLVLVTGFTMMAPQVGFAQSDPGENPVGESKAETTRVVENKAPKKISAFDSSGYDKVDVYWGRVPGISTYKVLMSKTKYGKYSALAKVKGNHYQVRGLVPGKKVYFKVASVLPDNYDGEFTIASVNTGNISKVASATPMLEAPRAKIFLKTGTKAQIKWTKVAGAGGYVVYKKSSSAGWNKVRTLRGRKLLQSHLKKKARHRYKIAAYRTVSGKRVFGKTAGKSIYVPRVLKKSTKTYSSTYQNRVLRIARSKLGSRYVYGASGPKRFDCSGFAYWVMKKAKVKRARFGRTTAQGIYYKFRRYNIGRKISKAQPGDLLMYGSRGCKRSIYHVAIYYGGGKIIHASTSGRRGCVKITRLYRRGNVAAIIRLPGMQ